MAISPDGRHILYHVLTGSTFSFYLRGSTSSTRAPIGVEVAQTMFFSPDSHWIGFYDSRARALKKIDIDGGSAMMITPLASMNGASWGDDDTIVFADGTGQRRPVSRARGRRGTARAAARDREDKGETD